MKHMRVRSSALPPFFRVWTALLLLTLSSLAPAANDTGVFWLAQKDNQTVYLLGSVHLASSDFYPLRDTIEQAYGKSDALVVEADVLAAESDLALQQKIMQASVYQGQRTLKDELSADVYRQLLAWLEQRKIPEAMFIRQRPAIAMVSMSMVELRAQGLEPGLGIDRHFLLQAHKSDKPVLELEGIVAQLEMLNNLDNPDLLLQQTLEQLEEVESFVPRMATAWKSGDMEALHELVIAEGLREHPEYASLYDVIFFDRNRTMAEKITDFSDRHRTLFVIVGAGHLAGDKSVLEGLKQRGFQLEQL
ncbi:TraB/GumN family protein [Microbulbifer sediminum]|uniref:TraB/GumN family protein n=1 Tax=Microbulbifer sediminum TaxID=2904250 RepID=UPI001F20231A|nr:TraB/GumN family protein [Microbulbifer sediminum]